jgi:PAS domain S-box-containing protein
MNNESLVRILFVEDLPFDNELAEWELRNEGLRFTSIRVETQEEFLKALEEFHPDLIISDYSLPNFDGLKALKIALKHDPSLPFILLTGSMNEETAVDCMKVGATDYVLKERIKRLPFAVREALEQKKIQLAKEEAERETREHQEEMEAIYQNSPLIMILLDESRRVRKVNGSSVESMGHSPGDLIGQPIGEVLRCLQALDVSEGCGFGPACGECTIHRTVKDTFETGQGLKNVEGSLKVLVEGNGTELTFLLSTTKLTIRKKPMVLVSFLDITERKQMEETIRQSDERYRTVIEEIDEGYYEVDLAGNFTFVNDSMIRQLQYSRKELIGMNYRTYIPPEEAKEIFKVFNKSYQTGEIIKWYPVTNIRKDGESLFMEDSISCRRDKEGQIVGFRGISRDITDRKLAEEKLNQTLGNLRKAMGGIIQVISATVETRDPYTAGHQRRTADLARAIAREMGLAEYQRNGLQMVGTIHDLGKVSIPAEILSKPTKLTEIELKLIKNHPSIGYEILKGIDFPWPLAEVVLQHHERMNGSGYPKELKGEDISLEARILMVADVVEAMASYRPYRPALGIKAALEEIEKNSGILYDPQVVKVCLRLIRENGFIFE